MSGMPLFADRRAAGRALTAALAHERERDPVVVGLARGGVVVAAEVARLLGAPLDAVAVRKVGHPAEPEYGIGGVTPTGVYLRASDGLNREQLAAVVAEARARAAALDGRLHADVPALELGGRAVVLVDDGLATGATMIAAARWAKDAGAARVVAAAPVGARSTVELVRREADDAVVLHPLPRLASVGAWYGSFPQVTEDEVIALLVG